MTDILARIRVRETHGIRRFLYPFTTRLHLPGTIFPAKMQVISLQDNGGQPVPMLLTSAIGQDDRMQRLDFAVSLAPYETRELLLILGQEPFVVNNPITFSLTDDGYRSIQSRFALTVRWDGMLKDVVYDGLAHLREPLSITHNGNQQAGSASGSLFGEQLLAAWKQTEVVYSEQCIAKTLTELTACKSWATITHALETPKVGDVVLFTLPLTVSELPLLCDFGVGGGIYSKIGANESVIWNTEFDEGSAKWTLATNGRKDYAGEVSSREEYHAQQWFHVIDRGKALAVAITRGPDACRTLTVTLNSTGDVQITFTLGEMRDEPAAFAVCYHFLNDAPAIAAATNPQSILLPPTVEVLPV